jgi:hypothetical protein
MPLSTLGTDPDYASLLGQRNDPRLLMAQKLMDVEKLPANNSTQGSFWANLLNQGARGALGGYLYHGVQADREKEAKAQEAEAAKFRTLIEAGPPGSAPVKDGSGGTAPAQPSSAPSPQGDPGDAGASIQDRLRQRESSGNYQVMNKQRYAGGYQFGSDLLRSNGMYQPTEQGEPANTWGGTFSIPGHPNVKTLADFRNTPEAQDAAYKIAMANNDKQLRDAGVYDRAANLPGVTRDGLLAGAWLGGVHGVAKWVDSGGQSNPGDANGTRIGDYVRMGQGGSPTRAARAPAMARGGQQADAGPGSNLDALLRGVDQPKPRGIQLAENLLPGGTATDSPTPILPNMAPVSTATAPLPFLTPPAQPEAATTPPIAAAVPPRRDVIPSPDAVPEPAVVPPPPEPAPDPAMIAPAGSGETGGQPTIPPQPPAEAAPAGSGETGGQPTVLPQEEPPLPVPPIPPALLARRRRGAPPDASPGGPSGGPIDLFKQAGLQSPYDAPASASVGLGPTGQQLAAALLPPGAASPATPDDAAMYAAGYGPAGGGAPGDQGGLVTPASGPGDATGAPGATTDTSAAGGQSKGAAPTAPAPSTADAQARADWYLTMARQAAGSSNPKIRAQAGVLEAQGQALQRRIDRQDLLDQRATERRDAAANRNFPIHEMQGADGKVHSVQIMPDGSQRDLGLSGNQHAQAERNPQHITVKVDGKNYVHTWNPATGKYENTGLLAEKQEGEPAGLYPGKDATSTDLNILDAKHDKIVSGKATEDEKREYSRSYNRLQSGADYDAPDPLHAGQSIRVPGHPTDLTGYAPPPYRDTAPRPGKAPTETERVAAGFASRMDLTNKEIDKIGSQSFGDVAAGRVPMVGNYLTSNQGQQFQTAAKAWVLAKLRKESGAAFGEGEWEREFSTYFPQPGDTLDRIALKKRLRDLETQNMQRDAGNAYTPSEPAATGGGGTPLPSDKSQLQNGAVYTLRDGRRGKWNGTSFEVQ